MDWIAFFLEENKVFIDKSWNKVHLHCTGRLDWPTIDKPSVPRRSGGAGLTDCCTNIRDASRRDSHRHTGGSLRADVGWYLVHLLSMYHRRHQGLLCVRLLCLHLFGWEVEIISLVHVDLWETFFFGENTVALFFFPQMLKEDALPRPQPASASSQPRRLHTGMRDEGDGERWRPP